MEFFAAIGAIVFVVAIYFGVIHFKKNRDKIGAGGSGSPKSPTKIK